MQTLSKIERLVLCLGLMLTGNLHAETIKSEKFVHTVGQYPEYLIDSKASYTFQDVIRMPLSKHAQAMPSFGWTNDVVWLRVSLEKQDNEERILELGYPLLDKIDIWIFAENSLVQHLMAGDMQANSPEILDPINPAFQIPKPSGFYTFLIRLESSSSIQAPLTVFHPKAWALKEKEEFLIIGIYSGILTIMAIYNLFIFAATRSFSYCFYSLFVLIFLILQLSLAGYAATYFWPENSWLSDYAITYGGLLGLLCAVLFSERFMRLTKSTYLIKKIVFTMKIIIFIAIAAGSILPYSITVKIMSISTALSMMILGGIAIFEGVWQGNRSAKFFLAAWSMLILGAVIYISKQLGFLPVNFLTKYAFMIGSACETALLSLALADRLNSLSQKIIRVQTNSAETLKLKNLELTQANKKLRHSYTQLAKVYYPHQVTQLESGIQLEHTMPIGKKKACVISFDIIESSRLEDMDVSRIFRSVFTECGNIMMRSYNPSNLQAEAFRIKELGDGFLCSVGFPFKSPHENIFDACLALSHEFLKILDSHCVSSALNTQIFAGIGIAFGDVEAFFAESPPIEYDLFGNGIVLATRYEQMRKDIFRLKKRKSSIIILQERIYQGLSSDWQRLFKLILLNEKSITVRDDPDASRLYYCFVDSSTKIASNVS